MEFYVKEEDLHKKFPANSNVTFFPNPRVIEVNGLRYNIIRGDDTMTVTPLTQAEIDWHVRKQGNFVKIVSSTGFFPHDLVAGIKGIKYSEDTELSQQTGWVNSYNTGSASCIFEYGKHTKALAILKAVGFKAVNE